MSTSASYSRRGYLRIKKESTAGTAVIPDTYLEITSEDIQVNWDKEQIGAIAGNRSLKLRMSEKEIGPFEGTIELHVEPKTVGHLLCGLLGEDAHTTATAGVSELSVFQPKDTLPTYTIDIARAGLGYVNRFFGVRITGMRLVIENNQLKAQVRVAAQRVFTNARVTTAAGSGTALVIDQTSGIVGTDTIKVLDKDAPSTVLATLTVTSVTDENTLVVSTIGASLGVGDIVVIEAETPDDDDYNRSKELTFVGGAEVFMGAAPDAIQRLTARSNAETLELDFDNGYEPKWSATGCDVVDRMPATILIKGFGMTGNIGQFHANPELTDILRNGGEVGIRVRFCGEVLEANVAAAASGTLETDGSGVVTVTAEATGKDGNDYAIKVVQGTGALSASLSGKLITVTLDATPANNTVSLVAAAVNALTGVASSSTGTDKVTTTDNPDKVYFAGGRDANEREMLEIDLPKVSFQSFTPTLGADDTIMDTVPLEPQRDEDDGREVVVRLRNSVTTY